MSSQHHPKIPRSWRSAWHRKIQEGDPERQHERDLELHIERVLSTGLLGGDVDRDGDRLAISLALSYSFSKKHREALLMGSAAGVQCSLKLLMFL